MMGGGGMLSILFSGSLGESRSVRARRWILCCVKSSKTAEFPYVLASFRKLENSH